MRKKEKKKRKVEGEERTWRKRGIENDADFAARISGLRRISLHWRVGLLTRKIRTPIMRLRNCFVTMGKD